MKHTDLDKLWLQQEWARHLLPLHKVKGEVNPAYLMTTYLPEAVILKHMGILDIEFADGRAKSAAQLHSVGPGAANSRKTLSTDTRILLLLLEKKLCVGKRHGGDSWDCAGKYGRWKRHHITWRRCMFTPFKVPGALVTNIDWTLVELLLGTNEVGNELSFMRIGLTLLVLIVCYLLNE